MTGTSRLSFTKIAVDANVLLAAALAGAASRVFQSATEVTFVTTAFNLVEMKRHLPALAARRRLPVSPVGEVLSNLPIVVHGEEVYASHLEEARRWLEKRDPKDVPLLALALALSIPIWSNDRHLTDLPIELVEVFPTAKLLAMLGISSRKE